MPLYNPVPLIGGTNFSPPFSGVTNGNRAATANLLYLMTVYVPVPVTLTGLEIENGATVTGNVLAGIYNAAGSSLLAQSASTAQSGSNNVQQVPFTGTYGAVPGTCIFAVMFSSSSATGGAGFCFSPSSQAAQGGFTLPSSVTPPTSPGLTYATSSY